MEVGWAGVAELRRFASRGLTDLLPVANGHGRAARRLVCPDRPGVGLFCRAEGERGVKRGEIGFVFVRFLD